MKRANLAAAALLAACGNATPPSQQRQPAPSEVTHVEPASRYWFIGVSTTHTHAHTANIVDVAHIRRLPNGDLEAWSENFLSPSSQATSGTSHFAALNEYDCTNRRSQTEQLTGYYADDRAPITMPSAMPWQYVLPGSTGEQLLDFVCASDAQRRADTNYAPVPDNMTPDAFAQLALSRVPADAQ